MIALLALAAVVAGSSPPTTLAPEAFAGIFKESCLQGYPNIRVIADAAVAQKLVADPENPSLNKPGGERWVFTGPNGVALMVVKGVNPSSVRCTLLAKSSQMPEQALVRVIENTLFPPDGCPKGMICLIRRPSRYLQAVPDPLLIVKWQSEKGDVELVRLAVFGKIALAIDNQARGK